MNFNSNDEEDHAECKDEDKTTSTIDDVSSESTKNNRNSRTFARLGGKIDVDTYAEYVKGSTNPSGLARFRSMVYDSFENIPDNLKHIIYGTVLDGNIERDYSQKPEWLDPDKLRRGQTFIRKNIFQINYAEYLSLFAIFSFSDALKPLILTGKSSTPYTAFKRYHSTLMRAVNWYTFDHWSTGSPAFNDFVDVRRMHANIRKRINVTSKETLKESCKLNEPWCPSRPTLLQDFKSSSSEPEPGQCPYHIVNMFTVTSKPLSQSDMCLGQFPFIVMTILYPKSFGIYASDDELESFCHVWRSIGYNLGIEDEFNLCRGTLKDVQERCRDLLEVWVKPNLRVIPPEWEHMMRCIVEGLHYYFPSAGFEENLLYFTDILNMPMTRLRKEMTFSMWIKYNFIKFFFLHIMRLPGMSYLTTIHYRYHMNKVKTFSDEKHMILQNKSANKLNEYRKSVGQTNYKSSFTSK